MSMVKKADHGLVLAAPQRYVGGKVTHVFCASDPRARTRWDIQRVAGAGFGMKAPQHPSFLGELSSVIDCMIPKINNSVSTTYYKPRILVRSAGVLF